METTVCTLPKQASDLQRVLWQMNFMESRLMRESTSSSNQTAKRLKQARGLGRENTYIATQKDVPNESRFRCMDMFVRFTRRVRAFYRRAWAGAN